MNRIQDHASKVFERIYTVTVMWTKTDFHSFAKKSKNNVKNRLEKKDKRPH